MKKLTLLAGICLVASSTVMADGAKMGFSNKSFAADIDYSLTVSGLSTDYSQEIESDAKIFDIYLSNDVNGLNYTFGFESTMSGESIDATSEVANVKQKVGTSGSLDYYKFSASWGKLTDYTDFHIGLYQEEIEFGKLAELDNLGLEVFTGYYLPLNSFIVGLELSAFLLDSTFKYKQTGADFKHKGFAIGLGLGGLVCYMPGSLGICFNAGYYEQQIMNTRNASSSRGGANDDLTKNAETSFGLDLRFSY